MRIPSGPQADAGPGILLLLLLCGVAVLINTLSLTIVFGMPVMLGPSIAVMAVLLWRGWAGLMIGAIASLSAWNAWGHPWGPYFLTAEILWLTLAVNRWRRPRQNEADGTIVLWDIAYWILIAAPLIFLIPHQTIGIEVADEWVVALKQLLNGMIATTLGFIGYIIMRLLVFPKSAEPITLRGVVSATVLVSICLPILLLSVFTSRQLADAIIATQFDSMQRISRSALMEGLVVSPVNQNKSNFLSEGMALCHERKGKQIYASNPALFRQLQTYTPVAGLVTPTGLSLELLIPGGKDPLVSRWLAGYWLLTEHFDAAGRTAKPGETNESIEIAEPAAFQIRRMEQQAIGMLTIFTSVMLIGSVFSQWLGSAISGEFRLIIESLKLDSLEVDHRPDSPSHPDTMSASVHERILPLLPVSAIGELRALLEDINARIHQIHELTRQLKSANEKLSHSRDELAILSITDSLTGCLNRRSLEPRLMEAMNGWQYNNVEFSLLCFDIDHLKKINDQFGHQTGDAIICFVVDLIRGKLRKTDCFYRLGGDEFLILLPNCSLPEACRLGSMFCEAVASAELPAAIPSPPEITISVGVVTYLPCTDTTDRMLRRADEALYESKARGRNQVSIR